MHSKSTQKTYKKIQVHYVLVPLKTTNRLQSILPNVIAYTIVDEQHIVCCG